MNNKQLQIYLQVFAYKNIIGLIVSHAFYVFIKADMLCPFALATMNPNRMIFDILMQFRFTKMFCLVNDCAIECLTLQLCFIF